MEIGGFASPNVNHFWGNCESLWQNDAPNFFFHSEPLLADCESLFKWIRHKTFSYSFLCPHPFFSQNFPFSDKFFVISCKNANKLQIKIPNSVSLCQSDS